jgi:hypothetical protein
MGIPLMKKTLLFVSIVILSITTQAGDSLIPNQAIEKGSANIANSAQTMLNTNHSILPENGAGNSNLWEMLDTDYDGFLSKTEAASSKDVFDNWDNLDINKDEKLDSKEFTKVFYQEN